MLRLPFCLLFLHVLCLSTSLVQGIPSDLPKNPPLPHNNQPTTFHVTSGANDNYFYRDHITTAQLLLTNAANAPVNTTRRLVAALPAGNNGALVYFLPFQADRQTGPGLLNNGPSSPGGLPVNINLINGTLTSTAAPDGNVGIQADVAFRTSATLGVTIVGAVRALRGKFYLASITIHQFIHLHTYFTADYVEGAGTMHEIFNYTLLEHSSTAVRLHRQYINATTTSAVQRNPSTRSKSQQSFKSVDLYLSIPPGSSVKFSVTPTTNGALSPPKIDIIVPPRAISGPQNIADTRNAVRFRVVTNETSLVGFDTDDLFMTPDQGTTTTLQGVLKGLSGKEDVIEQVRITALGVYLDRCLMFTAFAQVSFLTFQDKFVAGGWRFLTYFGRDSLIALRMLMPILTPDAIEAALGAVIERANSTGALCHEETIGDYASFVNIGNGRPDLGNTPFYDYKGQNRSSEFMSKEAVLQQGKYLDIVNRISSYNINRALPFYQASTTSVSNLLAFRPGQPVGNWRDSNQGTGYGTIPFDVNVALVPANLRAINSLIGAGILKSQDLDISTSGVDLIAVANKWEQDVPGLFEVTVSGEDAESRLLDFVQEVGLDQGLLATNNTSSAQTDVSFYALSLMPDGAPVQVLNSDLGFNLMYGTNLSAVFMGRVADALTAYPRGLLTNIGMVVANPAYDSNRTNVHVLDRTAYHGTVVWSFQQALMAGGLARQLSFCGNLNTTIVDITPPLEQPLWCDDAELLARLKEGQDRLWMSINGAAANIYSEVWSYSFDNSTKTFQVADLANLSPDGTESDAIQLWSYGFLGLIEPR
ncbi:hypothetical protein CVT24_004273 [Panaeolus cyanescens]|uniref:Uncharacterized protein n=1 Tax=Panaeolus cyanescens TaxID=181874 RepID=A0A409VA89_9AGAR|nr:hypothetical protein CVT24_004273 [Panaeolus cyanescens]